MKCLGMSHQSLMVSPSRQDLLVVYQLMFTCFRAEFPVTQQIGGRLRLRWDDENWWPYLYFWRHPGAVPGKACLQPATTPGGRYYDSLCSQTPIRAGTKRLDLTCDGFCIIRWPTTETLGI